MGIGRKIAEAAAEQLRKSGQQGRNDRHDARTAEFERLKEESSKNSKHKIVSHSEYLKLDAKKLSMDKHPPRRLDNGTWEVTFK
jgi:hypothetical protein